LAGVSEVVHQQGAHLPSVAHFLDHHPGDGAAVPVCGSAFEEVPLLLHAGEFGITLVHDHVDERVAHPLSGNLAEVLPLAAAFVRTKLDFFGIDGAVQGVKLEAGNLVVVNANLFAPIVKESDPITEGSDFRHLAWHNTSSRSAGILPALHYFALKTAGRFSTYAARPSLASSLWKSNC